MEHVFVETNWLVGCLAPAHHKVPAAIELLDKANRGEVRLYLPAICASECKRPIREKFQVKLEADRVRKFLLWAKVNQPIDPAQEQAVRQTLDKMEAVVRRDLDRLDTDLQSLRAQTGVEVFHIEEEMWLRNTELSYGGLQLQPFDQAILAAILVKAEMLRKLGVARFAFCEADSDLQPWNRVGQTKEPLVKLYDQLGIWVYGDFSMRSPAMPDPWPRSSNT